jgi:pimeloyl-CoA synthetase
MGRAPSQRSGRAAAAKRVHSVGVTDSVMEKALEKINYHLTQNHIRLLLRPFLFSSP